MRIPCFIRFSIQFIPFASPAGPDCDRIGVKLRKPHRGEILVEIYMPAESKPRRGDISRKIKRKKRSVAPLGLDKNASTIFTIIPPQKGLWTKTSKGLIQNHLDAYAIAIGITGTPLLSPFHPDKDRENSDFVGTKPKEVANLVTSVNPIAIGSSNNSLTQIIFNSLYWDLLV